MDKVFIEGLQIEALIGIYDWERRIRQPLEFDLEMAFDNRRPAATDAIADTLDYKAVSKRLIEYVGQSDFGLVETLAERVAAIVLDEFDVAHVRLKLSKPGAVRGARAVGVIIERSRQTARREGEKVAAWPATPAVVPVADTDDIAAPLAPREVAHGTPTHATPRAKADETDAAPAGATRDTTPAPATGPAIDITPAAAADPRLQAALSAAMSGWHSTTRTDTAAWAPEPAATVEHTGASAGTSDNAARPVEDAAAIAPAPEGQPLAAEAEQVLEHDPEASTKSDTSRADTTTAGAASQADAAEADAAGAAPAVEADATQAAPSEPAAPPAQRANFMRDLDEAPVRPGIAVAEALAVAGAAHDELPAGNDAPAHAHAPAAEPPPMPDPATEPAAVAEPAHFPTPPVAPHAAPAAPAAAASAAAGSNASPAAANPTVTASNRRAPPPPPRPRNPASDLGRETRPAYLSLGSNIEPEQNLRSALMALRARFGEVIVSPIYRMPAVGFEGPDFLNAAVIIDSDLDPFALTRWLRGIESAHGRMRTHVKNSSRTLDMDIIFFDDLVLDLPGGLQLPRPELRHAFVLKPLVDIAPGFVDPVRGTHLADVWASHPEHDQRFATVSI